MGIGVGTKREITVWITYEDDEDVSAFDSAKRVLEDLRVPGLVEALEANGLQFEWDVKVIDEARP